MLEYFKNASTLQQGFFVTIVGMGGVFIVLILFYIFIKLITRIMPEEKAK